MASTRTLTPALLAVALLLAAAAAVAQAPWSVQYQRGIDLEARQSWDAAAQAFEAAMRVEPRPRRRIATVGGQAIFDCAPPTSTSSAA
jgi:hypothetical protein